MYMQGFHKILKKHDKVLPHAPCQQFYLSHLYQQSWVQVSTYMPCAIAMHCTTMLTSWFPAMLYCSNLNGLASLS